MEAEVWGRFMVMQSGKKGTSTTNVGSTFFGTEPSIASELVKKRKESRLFNNSLTKICVVPPAKQRDKTM